MDVQIGYGEDTGKKGERYNTAVYVSGKTGQVLNKYRKVIFVDLGRADTRFTYRGQSSLSTWIQIRLISLRSDTFCLEI